MHIGLPDVDPGREKRPKPLEHQPFHIARRDAHPWAFAGDLQPEATPRRSSGIAWLSLKAVIETSPSLT
jgi:hypothetical protein